MKSKLLSGLSLCCLPQERIETGVDPPADLTVVLPQVKIVTPKTVKLFFRTIQFETAVFHRSYIQARSARYDAVCIPVCFLPAEALPALRDPVKIKIICYMFDHTHILAFLVLCPPTAPSTRRLAFIPSTHGSLLCAKNDRPWRACRMNCIRISIFSGIIRPGTLFFVFIRHET